METNPSDEVWDDLGLPDRLPAAPPEALALGTVRFEAQSIIMGGIDRLRQSPLGSLELGGALAAAGVALAALAPRLRHAH